MVDDRKVKIVITCQMSKTKNKKRGKQESGRRDMEDTRQTHMELLKIKNIIYEVKNTLDGINKKLDTLGEKANELEDMVTETHLEDRGKKGQKTKQSTRALAATVSSGLTHNEESQREEMKDRDQKKVMKKPPKFQIS